ncbi:radical SAM protein [Desulfatitalea tepidiphila]|uniref:radical SAM protein n=1 Tax=Desulfatitalea tepidiphila TaxID=1185843 RepID=UPI003F759AD9
MELTDRKLDQTLSLCPFCLKTLPATIRLDARGEVWMEWVCPEHGPQTSPVCPNLESYLSIRNIPRKVKKPAAQRESTDAGCPNDCGLCPAHKQHTCLAILEITNRCDAGCHICLANSVEHGCDLSIEAVEFALRRFIHYEGAPAPLQLSGGEPTLHANLCSIIRLAQSLGFRKIEIDTNGGVLSENQDLCFKLKEAGLSGIYLQMDGIRSDISRRIRGRDLTASKLKAIDNCKRSGLQVVLSVTLLPGLNTNYIWEMVQFGIHQGLTGVNFQPVVLSGRYPQDLPAERSSRLTLGHFQKKIETQSGGIVCVGDMQPIPCPSPLCGAMAYVIISNGKITPLNRLVGKDSLSGFLADQSDWEEVLKCLDEDCSCGRPCLSGIGNSDSLSGAHDFFSIGFHGMMDAFSFDIERAKRCCVHELLPDGRLIPFCLYNTKYRGKLPV